MILQALTTLFHLVDLQTLAFAIPGVILAVHLIPWLLDSQGIRNYPGPFLAKFTDIWLGCVSKAGHRSAVIHELHKKYGASRLLLLWVFYHQCRQTHITNLLRLTFISPGPIMRIAPNHISVAIPDALSIVYAHGSGATKSNFYDTFVSLQPSIFTTRDRKEHTRKRKMYSHIFSQRNVVEFEPHVRHHLTHLLQRWERLYDMSMKGITGDDGQGWEGRDGRLWVDCLPCKLFNFFIHLAMTLMTEK